MDDVQEKPTFKDLDNLTKEIFVLNLRIYEGHNSLNFLKDTLVLTQLRMSAEVAAEKTEDGKKKFSNEDQRQVEVKKRLSEQTNYYQAEVHIKEEEYELKLMEIRLQYLRDKLTNLRLFLQGEKNGQ